MSVFDFTQLRSAWYRTNPIALKYLWILHGNQVETIKENKNVQFFSLLCSNVKLVKRKTFPLLLRVGMAMVQEEKNLKSVSCYSLEPKMLEETFRMHGMRKGSEIYNFLRKSNNRENLWCRWCGWFCWRMFRCYPLIWNNDSQVLSKSPRQS